MLRRRIISVALVVSIAATQGEIMRKLRFAVLLCLLATLSIAAQHAASGVNADQALAKLRAGNKRYSSLHSTRPNQTAARRREVAKGQHPFAIIVSCSDSRVPPEVVFDQGLGDLFVVRVAGNIVDDVGLGSIEYAADHLGPQLILVLGHENFAASMPTFQGAAQEDPLQTRSRQSRRPLRPVGGQPGNL